MSKRLKFTTIILLTVLLVSGIASASVDHSQFIKGPFTDGPSVTAVCITCHEQEAKDVRDSVHFMWKGPSPDIVGYEDRTDLGKIMNFNNFCTSLPGNQTFCAGCHAGYGWESDYDFTDREYDFNELTNVDCLICHATEGDYKKRPPQRAGNVGQGVDLLIAAQSVSKPTRENCGKCHFYAGGGDGVKQGDLDSTLINPTRDHDVHMGGADMACIDCHETDSHKISGGSVHVIPTEGRVSCTNCHGSTPHPETASILNNHADSIACETCHIPTFSKGMPTKMRWEWSEAGKDVDYPTDKYGKVVYEKHKGWYVWEQNVTPQYDWYNGTTYRYIPGNPVVLDGVNVIAKPAGSISDPNAKIYPFKVHTGTQAADAEYKYLLYAQLYDETGTKGFWNKFDWDEALRDGAEASGQPFSGNYTFVETAMYIGINHEVVPKEYALECNDCHSENGRIDFVALGYAGDPMQTGGRVLSTSTESSKTKSMILIVILSLAVAGVSLAIKRKIDASKTK